MSDPKVHYPIFLVPLYIIIIFNLITFVIVLRIVVIQHKKRLQRSTASTIKTIVALFSVMCLFGIFWLFGIFSVYEAAIFFQWPFIIFKSSQGIVLFVFFGIIDGYVQWKEFLTCQKLNASTSTKSGAINSNKNLSTTNTSKTELKTVSKQDSSLGKEKSESQNATTTTIDFEEKLKD